MYIIHIYIYIYKHLIGDYGQNFAQDGFALYAWRPPGCLSGVTSFQVSIKEALAVFHWLTFCIILLCLLARGISTFLIQATTEESLNLLLLVEHSTQIHWRNGESAIWLLNQEDAHTIGKKLQITTNGKNRTNH